MAKKVFKRADSKVAMKIPLPASLEAASEVVLVTFSVAVMITIVTKDQEVVTFP